MLMVAGPGITSIPAVGIQLPNYLCCGTTVVLVTLSIWSTRRHLPSTRDVLVLHLIHGDRRPQKLCAAMYDPSKPPSVLGVGSSTVGIILAY